MPNEPLLASNEYVIGKYDEALKIDVPATVTQERRAEDVTLTNKRIIIHTEIMKLFRPTVHNYYEIPLSSIKVVDRRVQVFAEKNRRNSCTADVILQTMAHSSFGDYPQYSAVNRSRTGTDDSRNAATPSAHTSVRLDTIN